MLLFDPFRPGWFRVIRVPFDGIFPLHAPCRDEITRDEIIASYYSITLYVFDPDQNLCQNRGPLPFCHARQGLWWATRMRNPEKPLHSTEKL